MLSHFLQSFFVFVFFFQRALQVIEKYRKFIDSDENVYREYDITKARILKKCGYEEAARLLLSHICTAKSGSYDYDSSFSELLLKARMLLAEFDMEACRPDLAVSALKTVHIFEIKIFRLIHSFDIIFILIAKFA